MSGSAYSSPFAAVTEEVSRLLRDLPRAAKELWEEIRRNAVPGKPTEFNIEELAQKLNYTSDWLKKALNRLIDVGLVEYQRRSWRGWVRLLVYDPGLKEKTSEIPDKTSKIPNKNPEKQPSNADSLVVQDLENLKNTKTITTHHPVKNEQKKNDLTSHQTPKQLTAQTALREVREAGISVNVNIQNCVLSTIAQLGKAALPRIRDAIAVVAAAPDTHKKTGKPTNREGLFVQALKKGWKPRTKGDTPINYEPEPLPASDPSRSPLPEQRKEPDGFESWYGFATKLGYVRGVGRYWQAGSYMVETIPGVGSESGKWQTFDELQGMYPLKKLQREYAERYETTDL